MSERALTSRYIIKVITNELIKRPANQLHIKNETQVFSGEIETRKCFKYRKFGHLEANCWSKREISKPRFRGKRANIIDQGIALNLSPLTWCD